MLVVLFTVLAVIFGVVGWLADAGWASTVAWTNTAAAVLMWGLARVVRRRYPRPDLLVAAAEAGEHRAMRGQAMAHKLTGDPDSAERLLRAAADTGDVESMWEMGRLVEQRDGIDAAQEWFRRAADHRHFVAGRMFRPGGLYNRDGTARALERRPVRLQASSLPMVCLYGIPVDLVAMFSMLCQVAAGALLVVPGGPWWLALLAYAVTAWAWGGWRDHARDPAHMPRPVFGAMILALLGSVTLFVWALLR